MKTTAQKIRLQYTESGNTEIVLTTKDKVDISELKEAISKGKTLSVEVKQYRKSRSLDANGMLWSIMSQIAEVLRTSKDEVYLQMLERYGVFTHIIVKQEAVERIKQEWRTVRVLGEVTINGKTGIQLQCYYGSHLLDTKEFSALLDGVISEAKELGIEILSKSELELIKKEWGK